VVGKFSATNAPAPYKVKVAYNGGDNNDVVLQIWTNAPPHADNMVVQATKDTPKPFALQGTDANGDPLTFEFTTPTAQGGTVALQGGEPAGSSNVVYNPPAGFTGWDTFTFRANDGEFNSGWAIVSNQVVGGNNPPTVTVPASADPNPVAGSQTALSVAGDDDFGAGNLTFTWSTTNTPPEPVGYSDNGTTSASNTTATFTKAGFYGFRVVMQDTGGLSATSGVDVVVDQTLTSISLTPLTTLVRTNMTRQFAAAAVDQFADPMSVPYAWSVSGGGTIDGTGLFTATTVGGPFTVQAVSASVTGLATVASVYAGVVDVGGNNSAARPATWAGLADALADATLYVASGNVLVRLSSYDGAGGPANYKRQASEVNTKRLIVSNTNAAARLTIEGGYSQDFSSTSGQTTVDGNMNTDVNPGGTITTTTASTPEAARVFTLTGAGQIVMRNLDVTGGGRTTGDTTVLVGGGINVAAKARLSGLTVRHCMNVNGGGGGIYTDSGSGGSVFENLVIRGNKTVGGTAAGGGFRVYTPSGTLLVANCVFRDNRAADVTYSSGGSHLYKGNEAATVVFGSVFYDAYSSNYGALNDSNTGASVPLLIVNSTVANNPQLAYYQDRMNSSVRVRNCISADNGSTGQGINFASGTKAMGRTLFDDDTVSGSFTDEGGNVGTDGSAHDPEFRDQGNRDYRLTAASAEAIDKGGYLGTASVAFANGTATVKFVDVNNSGVGAYQALTDVIVDVGGFAGLTEADYEAHFIYTTDIAGNPRLSDGDRAGGAAIDMGAYEFPTPAPSGMILIVR
jgi:hypothetical protein